MYMPTSISVLVEPSVLSFSAVGEKKSFTVKVTGPKISQQPIISGAITWKDGANVVRTPLVVYNYVPGAPYNLDSDSTTELSSERKPSFQGSNSFFGRKNDIFGNGAMKSHHP